MEFNLSVVINLLSYKQSAIDNIIDQIHSQFDFPVDIIAVTSKQISNIKCVDKTYYYLDDLQLAVSKAEGKYIWVISEFITITKLSSAFVNLLKNKNYDIIIFQRKLNDWSVNGVIRPDITSYKLTPIQDRFIGEMVTFETSFIKKSLVSDVVNSLSVISPKTQFDQMILKIIITRCLDFGPSIHFTSIKLFKVISSLDRYLSRVNFSLWENSYKLIHQVYDKRLAEMLCTSCTIYLLRAYHAMSSVENNYLLEVFPLVVKLFSKQFIADNLIFISSSREKLCEILYSIDEDAESLNLDRKYLGYGIYKDNPSNTDYIYITNYNYPSLDGLAEVYPNKIKYIDPQPSKELFYSPFWQKVSSMFHAEKNRKKKHTLFIALINLATFDTVIHMDDPYYSFAYLGDYADMSLAHRLYSNRLAISTHFNHIDFLDCNKRADPLFTEILDFYKSLTEEQCNKAKNLIKTYSLYRVIKHITGKHDSYISYKDMLIHFTK